MSDKNKVAYGGIISSTNLGFEFPGNYGFLNELPIESDRKETKPQKSILKKINRSAIPSKESKVTFGDMRYLIACYVNIYV